MLETGIGPAALTEDVQVFEQILEILEERSEQAEADRKIAELKARM